MIRALPVLIAVGPLAAFLIWISVQGALRMRRPARWRR
jgi:hypothetical protein